MNNTVYKQLLAALLLTLGASTAAIADELVIPVGQQMPEKQALQRPANGLTQTQVEERFGEPESKTASVGEPPISSWEYPDYIVYFEYNRVLHSVLKRQQPEDQQ